MAAVERAHLDLHEGLAQSVKQRSMNSLLMLTPEGRLQLFAGDSYHFNVAIPMSSYYTDPDFVVSESGDQV